MPQVVKLSTFSEIMLAVKSQLMTSLSLADRCVILARRRYIPQLDSEKDVVLIAGRARPDDGRFTGGGRTDFEVIRTLTVLLRLRRALDRGDSDESWLIRMFDLEDQVLDALQEFHPEDSGGNLLTVAPIRISGDLEPVIDNPDAVAGGSEPLMFEIIYSPNIDV